jgi:CRISPR-associated protein Csb2
MLSFGIRYLTGYAVATEVSNREKAEWPPHPARIFMAMAAAMFETGEDNDERESLLWLEGQGNPSIKVSNIESRNVVIYYVPVNDTSSPINKKGKPLTPLQSASIGRDRQPRTLPKVRPNEDVLFLVWPDSNPSDKQRQDLKSICAKVTRIGHSSSLVQMWVEETPPVCNLIPSDLGDVRLRVVSSGTLEYLESMANVKAIQKGEELKTKIAELDAEVKASKGKGSNEKKEAIQQKIEALQQELVALNPHPPLRPTISQWQGYVLIQETSDEEGCASGVFDRNILVLTLFEGPVIGLETTWRMMTALHKTILSQCDPSPEWLSGHTDDGKPSEMPHLALFPMAYVGSEHADGHLMGIGLALPKGISVRERGRALQGLLYDGKGDSKDIRLKCGSLGDWTLARETRPTPPLTLQERTWIEKSAIWATVTPIVLDRHPKTERSQDRAGLTAEVATIIAESCTRQGLPEPVAIDVDKTSWHRGAPRAVAGKSAGYPLMPVKSGKNARQQVHAWIQFSKPVEGPLLLGAGRYRGYGLCRPWRERR